MRSVILLEDMRAINFGIDLRCRKTGMSQKLLDGPQIRSICQEMGGERVTECVRRRGIGQRKRAAQALNQELNITGVERSAFYATKQEIFWQGADWA